MTEKDLSRTDLYALLEDVRADNDRLRNATIYDALTGLHSRAYLTRELARCWASSCYDAIHTGQRAASLSRPFAVIMVDIDHFKLVNDNHGHDVGDVILREVAEVLAATIREEDVMGRWGGEEFMAVLPSASQVQAILMARRIRLAIEKAEIGKDVLDSPITVSVGVSGAGPSNPAETPEAVVKCSDRALYVAKDNGRNRVEEQFVEVVA